MAHEHERASRREVPRHRPGLIRILAVLAAVVLAVEVVAHVVAVVRHWAALAAVVVIVVVVGWRIARARRS